MAQFVPTDHAGHNLHGSELLHWSGSISVMNDTWWAGDNHSDDVGTIITIEGCYDCDVEFDDE